MGETPFPLWKEPFALTHMNGSAFVRRGPQLWEYKSLKVRPDSAIAQSGLLPSESEEYEPGLWVPMVSVQIWQVTYPPVPPFPGCNMAACAFFYECLEDEI